jgi:hypothetical protein
MYNNTLIMSEESATVESALIKMSTRSMRMLDAFNQMESTCNIPKLLMFLSPKARMDCEQSRLKAYILFMSISPDPLAGAFPTPFDDVQTACNVSSLKMWLSPNIRAECEQAKYWAYHSIINESYESVKYS